MRSWSEIVLAFAAGLAVAGCATSARDLPPDYGSVNATQRLRVEDFDPRVANLSCRQISDELKALDAALSAQHGEIRGKRDYNQAVGFIGNLFFLPIWFATDNSNEAKAHIEKIEQAKDKLHQVKAFKQCADSPARAASGTTYSG